MTRPSTWELCLFLGGVLSDIWRDNRDSFSLPSDTEEFSDCITIVFILHLPCLDFFCEVLCRQVSHVHCAQVTLQTWEIRVVTSCIHDPTGLATVELPPSNMVGFLPPYVNTGLLPPYDQFLTRNDRRMYLPLTTVTGVYLCDVRKRLPVSCTVDQVCHSLVVKDLFQENNLLFWDPGTPC